MTFKRASLPAALALAAVVGAGIGATYTPPAGGIGSPTPASSAPFVLPEPFLSAVTCEEDEPCFDCETMGNRICGTMSEPLKGIAWEKWDAMGGAEHLLVDTHARVSLTGYAVTDPYDRGAPELATNQLALPESGVWFVFTADRP